jgi:lipopolysaccharide transport system ATP-binding protein
MICGTLNPTCGSIQTEGRVAALLELGSGFNPEFTGRENIFLNASVLGLSKNEIEDRLENIISFADIGNFIDQPVKTYSSGMTVRLAFSVIVHVDAEVLVIDEALSVGDVFFTQKCMRFLRDFMTRGTVLFVSHDTGAVVNLCNQAILLDRGHIVDIGEPKAVTKYYLTDTHGHYKKDSESDLTPIAFSDANSAPEPLVRDMREELLRQSKFRNDIEIFEFQPDHSGFGAGGAEIVSVELLDEDGARLTWVIGGEDVVLRIRCQARTKLCSPIIGFDFRDRLGQVLFGENTYLSYQEKPVELDTGEITVATFAFRLPLLPTGDYSITAAIAEGCQEKHVQQHWMHEALILKVHASSIRFGLVGLPMDKILLSKPL